MNTKNTELRGHLNALITIIIWGTTYISTKVLLRSFSPIEILFTRFVIGYLTLWILYPRRLKLSSRRQEWLFIGAGISGITLYYLLENIALTMTTATNVGIIITLAPFFTGLLSCVFLKTEKPSARFYIGFVAAMIGVALISLGDTEALSLNPFGDLLALLAAVMWAVYSILIRKISDLGAHTIQTTRRIFFYGLLFMIPMLFFMDFHLELSQFASAVNLGNMLFLGFGASALCFVSWNFAVKQLGAVKTSVYIYLVPVVTMIASVLVLHEVLTVKLLAGAALTLLGLWLSQSKLFDKKKQATA